MFRMEIDEQVDLMLPTIVDDDGDPVGVASIDWTSSDETVAVLEPTPDGMAATLKSKDVIGQVRVEAKVTTPDGGVGTYFGDVSLGLGVPVGGEFTFGTPTKRS